MKNILFVIAICVASITSLSAQTGPKTTKDPVQISSGPKNNPTETKTVDKIGQRATAISKKIKLEESKYKSLYNVIEQTEKRIEDLSMETSDYGKMLVYIHQERNEMLKALLTPAQYKDYQISFGRKDATDMNKLVNKSTSIVTRKKATEARDKKMADALMKKDKDKQKQLDQKEKDKAKQILAKEKATEKRALDKQKATEKREKDKQKALDKKEKDRLKKEAAKQKEMDKRAAAMEKRLK